MVSEDQMFVIIINTAIKTKTESSIGTRGMQIQMGCAYTVWWHYFSMLTFTIPILPEICLEIYINQLQEKTQMFYQKCSCQPISLSTNKVILSARSLEKTLCGNWLIYNRNNCYISVKKKSIKMREKMKQQVSKYQRALKAPLTCTHFAKNK